MNCHIEACILALKDTEVLSTNKTNDGKLVTYRSLRAQGSTGRAVMHGVLDLATLGIWEAAGTPIEGAKKKIHYFVYDVSYDKSNDVKKITVKAAS